MNLHSYRLIVQDFVRPLRGRNTSPCRWLPSFDPFGVISVKSNNVFVILNIETCEGTPKGSKLGSLKKFFCIIMLLIGMKLHAQTLPNAAQRWRELNLTKAQKEQIRVILLRRRIQQQADKDALDRILTAEQKKRLKEWREKKEKKSVKSN